MRNGVEKVAPFAGMIHRKHSWTLAAIEGITPVDLVQKEMQVTLLDKLNACSAWIR